MTATPSTPPEPPMLDVHPPHHAANSWRDFFIHIATIVVGLLIAIGLEQTVEVVHHYHQRVELEHELRAEVETNLKILALNDDFYTRKRAALVVESLAVAALHTQPSGGIVNIRIDRGNIFRSPESSSWETAKESASVALLPSAEAEVFNHVNRSNEISIQVWQTYFNASTNKERFETNFLDSSTPPSGAAVPVHMSQDELKQYSRLISDTIYHLDVLHFALTLARATTQAVLDGATSVDDLQRSTNHALTSGSTSPISPSH